MKDQYRKALKNYTTTVPANRSLSEINQILIDFGAKALGSEIDDQGRIETLHFKMIINGREQFVKVPLRVKNVIEVLKKANKYRDDDHAYRVAMRNVKDLLDAQAAFLATEMVTFEELMLPFFIAKDGKTIYEVLENKQFQLTV